MESPREEAVSDKQQTLANLPISEALADGQNHSSGVLRELHNLFNSLFTKENIESDTYLQTHMNSAMVIPIIAVINCPRVRSITVDADVIRHALATCPAVTLIEDSVRPNFKVEQNTIILRDIPSATSSDELLQIFKSVPSCPAVKSIRSDMNDTWFVAFHNEEAARAALLSIRNSTFNSKPIRARLKTESITKSFYSPRYRSGEGNAPPSHAPGGPPPQVPPDYFYRMQQQGGGAPMQSPPGGVPPHMFYFPPNFIPPGSPMYMPMPPPHHWQQGPRGGGRHGKGSPRQGGVGGWASSPQSPRGTPMAVSHKYPPTSSPRDGPMQPMYMATGQMPPPPHMVMMVPPHGYPHMPPQQPPHDEAPPVPHHHHQHHTASSNASPTIDGNDAADANRNKTATAPGGSAAGPKRNRSGSGGVAKKKGEATPSSTPRGDRGGNGAGRKGGSGSGKGGRGNKSGRGQSASTPAPAAEFNMEADFPALDNAPGAAGSSPLTTASPAGQVEGEMPQGSWAAAVKKRPSGGASNNNNPPAPVPVAPPAPAAADNGDGDASEGTGATRRSSKSITIIDPVAEGLIEHNSFGHYRPPTPAAPPLSPCTAREVATAAQGTASKDTRPSTASAPVEEVVPPVPNGSSNSSPAPNSDNNSNSAAKSQDNAEPAVPPADCGSASSAPGANSSASSSSTGKVSFRDVVRRGKP